MKEVIKEYIRDEARNPVGVVVAVRDGSSVTYGYSLCSPRDNFNKYLGQTIAVQRATQASYNLPAVDDRETKVTTALLRLSNRAVRYFKDLSKSEVEFVVGEDDSQG